MAVVKSITFAYELRLLFIIIEKVFVVISEDESLASFGNWLCYYKAYYIDAFSFISFSSICRLGNSVVYNLAKHARYASGYSI